MPAPVLFHTGIPDELDGLDIVFANAFEREEKPGGLSVLLLHAETQTLLAPGDEFALGGRRYRLDAIEAHGSGYRVAVTRLDAPPPPSPTPRRESKEFGIPPIGAHDLGALLRALSPAVLARLAGGAGDPPALEWTRDARETMNTEWNGERIGPITTSQHAARFPGGEAAVTVEDIRYAPEETTGRK